MIKTISLAQKKKKKHKSTLTCSLCGRILLMLHWKKKKEKNTVLTKHIVAYPVQIILMQKLFQAKCSEPIIY